MASKIDKGEVKMRVYRLTDELREAIDATRAKREQTLEEFISESVSRELPTMATELLEMGIEKRTALRPARWPLEAGTLQALAYASEQTGLDQNKLLIACLTTACRRKRRKRIENPRRTD